MKKLVVTTHKKIFHTEEFLRPDWLGGWFRDTQDYYRWDFRVSYKETSKLLKKQDNARQV